jgi:hypothetical protein
MKSEEALQEVGCNGSQKNTQISVAGLNQGYGAVGVLAVVAVFVFLGVIDTIYLRLYSFPELKREVIFSSIMMNLLGGTLILFPYFFLKTDVVVNRRIEEFLALPDRDAKITFPVIYDFLGGQALGGFLGTVLMITARQVDDCCGVVGAGVWSFVIAVLTVMITVFSLLRFIMHFVKYRWAVYGSASIVSLIIMFGCFWVGVSSVSG